MEDESPLRENGANIGQVGVPWPERTLVEEAVKTEHGEWIMVNVTRVRELSQDQPYEAEDVLSLQYPTPLRMNREKEENLLRGNIEPQVMARVLLLIIKYVNRRKFPGLDESQWPLSPFFIRALRSLVKQVSEIEGCSFLKRSFAWKGARWYFSTLGKLVKQCEKDGHGLPPECRIGVRDVMSARRLGFPI